MADIQAAPGVAILTTSTTLYTNPAGSGRNVLARVAIVNIDGAADAALNTCIFRDASAAASTQILPVGYIVKKLEGGVKIEKVLEPGDYIAASASAAGDLAATVDLFWEPA